MSEIEAFKIAKLHGGQVEAEIAELEKRPAGFRKTKQMVPLRALLRQLQLLHLAPCELRLHGGSVI